MVAFYLIELFGNFKLELLRFFVTSSLNTADYRNKIICVLLTIQTSNILLIKRFNISVFLPTYTLLSKKRKVHAHQHMSKYWKFTESQRLFQLFNINSHLFYKKPQKYLLAFLELKPWRNCSKTVQFSQIDFFVINELNWTL